MSREFFRRLFHHLPQGVLVLPDGVSNEYADVLVPNVRHRVPSDADVPGRDHEYETANDIRRFILPAADSAATLKDLVYTDAGAVRVVALTAHAAARQAEIKADNVTPEVRAMILVVIVVTASADLRNMRSDKLVKFT